MPRTNESAEKIRLLELDPWLKPFEKDIALRMNRYRQVKSALVGPQGSLKDFANGHHHFGFHRTDGGWIYREWAPDAEALSLVGDFNHWNGYSHPLARKPDGTWEIELSGANALQHGSRVKVRITAAGETRDRIPLYIRKVVQDPVTHDFSGQVWHPESPYVWEHSAPRNAEHTPLFIYEAHVGMAQEAESIGTYREFADHILPRIKAGGYTAIQLMAVMEHPYYASFGYHVSNFFAAASWFGTPEDLKYLIDTAHGMGLCVLMDLVHSHAVKNISEGINAFDGTVHQFFHHGKRGDHSAWDSKLFNYAKHEVIHFLLSNLKFWLEEYHFDGFRFDGVTSMCYHNHGLGTDFDRYDKYFSLNTDVEAITYLQLANTLIREVCPGAITVAEDMSGMPGMAVPVEDGGIGFDYRLAMGMPDFWIKLLKIPDHHWDVHTLWHELTTHRPGEKRIGYAESHDQALVGDKTLIFRLADKAMYTDMSKGHQNHTIDRAMALHKLIRFSTASLGCEGYLNFMGNEFGHPEWIDFPREGNGWSFKHCKRQWSLADSPFLRYQQLLLFDRQMLDFVKSSKLMGTEAQCLWLDGQKKLMAFSKGNFIFLFNFNPTESFAQFPLPTPETGDYRVIFHSDLPEYGGHGRISESTVYKAGPLKSPQGATGFLIYSPCRTAIVFEKI